MNEEQLKQAVRERYASFARTGTSCCGPVNSSAAPIDLTGTISRKIGYDDEDLTKIPAGSNLGLGCGNPVALASIRQGETVLDLGAGAGIDCFLAADRVGPTGRVIGVDMTPEMVTRARENARKGNYGNVEFRLGEIENLPVADDSVDLIISNCVINLSTDKPRVFREAFRVLKPGGRLMISDIVLHSELPEHIRKSIEAYVGCVAGAMVKDQYLEAIRGTGFERVTIDDERSFPVDMVTSDPTAQSLLNELTISSEDVQRTVRSVVSISVHARKPAD